jgi:hypothetical protein
MGKQEAGLEQVSRGLYREYGISEWREKTLILTKAELSYIYRCLKSGEENELVELVKLPFPEFVEKYYMLQPGSEKYLKDPTFAYRLYAMRDTMISYINADIKNPDETLGQKLYLADISRPDIDEIREYLETPYCELVNITSVSNQNNDLERRLDYISQYIDAKKAESLGFTTQPYYCNEVYKGFELEQKLAILNRGARWIIVMYLGLYGGFRKNTKEIADDLGLPVPRVRELINYIFPCFKFFKEALQTRTGYINREYSIGERKEYRNLYYRKLDEIVECAYIRSKLLPSGEKLILDSMSNSEANKYIKKKYLSQAEMLISTGSKHTF